jgi:hypothetical protein
MSPLKDAGSLVSSLGTRARLMIVGVVFPGLLITSEVIWLYLAFIHSTESTIPRMIDSLGTLKPLPGFVFLSIGLALACAVGYLNRDGSFAISNLWLRMGWPPARELRMLFERFRLIYGEDLVNEVTSKYGVFRLVDAPSDVIAALPRLPESYVREFCKLWLANNAPALSTEGTEAEINIVIGLVTPITLAAVVIFTAVGSALGATLGVLAFFCGYFLLYRVNSARVMETESAVLNFLFVHWESYWDVHPIRKSALVTMGTEDDQGEEEAEDAE